MANSYIYITVLFLYTSHCLPFEDNNVVNEYDGGGTDLAHLGMAVFGKPNEDSGRNAEQWNEDYEVNPEELGNYVEGDILFPNAHSKNGLIAETARWPNGEVPFEISGYFNHKEREVIKNAMIEYHEKTCIRFRRRQSTDRDWISITSTNTGCWSSVGRTGSRQDVNLQTPNCLAKIGTVIHELLHALGFQHEQNRWERDSYVAIHWNNIQKGKEGNFKKAGKDTVSGFGVPYDYGSVMHYSAKAFSTNSQPTITVITDTNEKIGQREGFSKKDLEKIHIMYNCPISTRNETSPDIDINSNEGTHGEGVFAELISIFFPQ